jgi:hypothetical protein
MTLASYQLAIETPIEYVTLTQCAIPAYVIGAIRLEFPAASLVAIPIISAAIGDWQSELPFRLSSNSSAHNRGLCGNR